MAETTITARRLRIRMDEIGIDQPDLADAAGCTQGAISQILLGNTRNSRFLPKIAEVIGVNVGWLLGSTEEKELPHLRNTPASPADAAEQLDSVMVPLYDLNFSMGGGAFFSDAASIEQIPFKKPWLRSHIAGRLDQVMMIYGRGDSMKPTIDDGDVLLVDRAQVEVSDPDMIWAFSYGDTGMVKRLRRLPKGGFLVQSDNAVVKDFKAADDELHIVGRVVSILRWQ